MPPRRSRPGYAAGPAGQDLPVLYHATMAGYLPGIAEAGLVPSGGRGAGVGKGAYGSWSAGKVFLSGPEDAFFWFGTVEQHAGAGSDNPRRDGMIPVLLRIKNLRRLLGEDTVAKAEMHSDSYFVRRRIPPAQIEVYNGQRWVRVDRYSDDDEVLELVREHTVCERDTPITEEEWESSEAPEDDCDWVALKMDEQQQPTTMPPEIYPGLSRGRAGRGKMRKR